MARVRVHQHVNPNSPYYRQPPEPVDPETAFADAGLPMHIDIGCARGRFILRLAGIRPECNYLGVEIREPLVDEANRLAAEAGLGNLRYVFCNAMISLAPLLENIPHGIVRMITIQFPDPWFKKRHAKRRMVNEELVRTAASKLVTGGRIFIQTDVEFLADEMFTLFRSELSLAEIKTPTALFLVKTEREKAVEDKGLPVYRTLFEKR